MTRNKEPSPEDFSPGAVQKAVLKQTVQHPLTILPAAIGAVSGMLMLVEPSAGVLAAIIGSGFVSVGAWIFNYFIRGESLAKKHVETLKARLDEKEHEERQDFLAEFQMAGFMEGARELKELDKAYDDLVRFLKEKAAGSTFMSPGQFLEEASNTYKKGLSLLRQALKINEALQSINLEDLENEIRDCDRELKKKAVSESQKSIQLVKKESAERRIKSHQELEQKRDELLEKSNGQEEILVKSYLQLVELLERGDDRIVSEDGEKTSALERRIDIARKVEERLRNAGKPSKEDEMYLKASEKPSPQ